MSIREALLKRRTVYALNKVLPVTEDEVIKAIEETVALVPDAFDSKSQRVVVALGDKHNELWDAIFDAFEGKVAREKIDGFKAAAGTILYFTDESVTKGLMESYPDYAPNFPVWHGQANGMLQISVWAALSELGVGANLQHYNPVIDEAVRKLFNVPDNYVLVAEMPFGGISAEPAPKAKEDISNRVKIAR